MKIDESVMKETRYMFESKYGSLKKPLAGLTKRERRNLLRYGKLPKRIHECKSESKDEVIDELMHISFEYRKFGVSLMKPHNHYNKSDGVRVLS